MNFTIVILFNKLKNVSLKKKYSNRKIVFYVFKK